VARHLKKRLCSTFVGISITLILIAFMSALMVSCESQLKKGAQPTKSPSQLASNEKDDLELLYQKGKEAQKSFDLDEATIIYKKILERDPHHYRSRKRLGEIYYIVGEYEPAIREFKKVIEENPRNPGAAKSNLVLCYLAVDRPENALKYISPEIDRYSRWGTHYSFLTQALYSQYMLSESKDEKEKILSRIKNELKKGIGETENTFGRSMLKASSAMFENKPAQVKKNLEKALLEESSGRDRVSILFLVGALEAREGKNKKALAGFQQVLNVIHKSNRLEFQNFMDGFYSLMAKEVFGKDTLRYDDIKSLIEKIPGGIREPEMKEFIEYIRDFLEERKSQNYGGALKNLQAMEKSIGDESIEGDYFYDGIYKPFILSLVYLEMGRTAKMAGDSRKAEEYYLKARKITQKSFPE